jgi:ATP-dependent helicase Lhr and Lhr-like helicase
VTIGTTDPLNLAGIVTSGDRIRTTARNRIIYRDGVPIAVMESGVIRALAATHASTQHDVSNAFRMRRVTTSVA